jgi:hypothetical protein
MRELVETYRNVEVYRSELILAGMTTPDDWHEARFEDWRFVGSLNEVKREIDKRFDPDKRKGNQLAADATDVC